MNSTVTWLTCAGQQIACCVIGPGWSLNNAAEQAAATHPTVVFCGGFKSNMQGTKALAIEQYCSSKNWSCVRFDYTGHGQSEGNFAAGNIDSWLQDTLTVIDAIDNPHGVLIVGSSMGAWIATLAALKRNTIVRGLITIAAAPDFTERLINDKLEKIQLEALQSGQPVNLPSDYDDGSPYPITLQLIDNSRQHCLLNATNELATHKLATHELATHELGIPVRMMHGTEDTDVPYTLSIDLMESLQCKDARLTLIKGADHRLSSATDIKLLEATISEMMKLLRQ